MKEYTARTSFSLPPKMLDELDELTKDLGYRERSRTIQTAIRSLVDNSRASKDLDAYAIGSILMLYDHTKRRVEEMITDVGHHYGRLIVSSLHVHLEDPNCLNIIVVKGRLGKILELEQHMRELGGVSQIKISYVLAERPEDDQGSRQESHAHKHDR